jgi:hypothetical protein
MTIQPQQSPQNPAKEHKLGAAFQPTLPCSAYDALLSSFSDWRTERGLERAGDKGAPVTAGVIAAEAWEKELFSSCLDKGWFPNTPGSAGSIAEQRMYRTKTVKACNDDDWGGWIDKKKKTVNGQNDDGGRKKTSRRKLWKHAMMLMMVMMGGKEDIKRCFFSSCRASKQAAGMWTED